MPMIDLDTTLVELDGVTAMRSPQNKVLKLRAVVIEVLLANLPGPAEEKLENFNLAEKINKNEAKEMDFTSEEITSLKKRIGQAVGPVIMKRCWDILDPRAEEPDEKED